MKKNCHSLEFNVGEITFSWYIFIACNIAENQIGMFFHHLIYKSEYG